MTRTTTLTAAAFGVLSLTGIHPVLAQDAKTILTKVNSAYAGMKSYQADMIMDVPMPQGKMTMNTVMKQAGSKMAMKVTGKMPQGAPAGSFNMDMVLDGKNMYMYIGMLNQYIKTPINPQMQSMMNQQRSSPDQILKAVKAGSVKKLADSTVDGKPVFVLSALQPTPQGSSNVKLFIDKSTYHIRRMEGLSPAMAGMGGMGGGMMGGGGGGGVSATIRNEKINPAFPASTFVFTPPKGATEMKMPAGGGMGAPRRP